MDSYHLRVLLVSHHYIPQSKVYCGIKGIFCIQYQLTQVKESKESSTGDGPEFHQASKILIWASTRVVIGSLILGVVPHNNFALQIPACMNPFPVMEHLLCCFAAFFADQGLTPQTGKSYLCGS